jgi:hypothetical protein
VHPSWRDLVIDELRDDVVARRRFLGVCGVDGIALALSEAGGVSGERTLPLLTSDADWDLLGDRLHELLPGLEDQEIARVLLAVEGALGTPDKYEAQGLAAYLLAGTRRALDHRHQPVPVFLLEAWYTLSRRVAERIDPPHLGPTWAELHPGSLLLERPDRAELARAEEWLALAQVLARLDPGALEALGFFESDRVLLARLIVTLRGVAADDDLRPLSEAVLARIESLVPDLASGAHDAIEIGRLTEDLRGTRWWVPEDISAPPTTEPVAGGPIEFSREDVDRVLRDL